MRRNQRKIIGKKRNNRFKRIRTAEDVCAPERVSGAIRRSQHGKQGRLHLHDSAEAVEKCAGEIMMNNKLYETALSYVGTPYINGANVKGAGLDCCTLITNIYQEMGWADIPMEFGYSGDWYCQKNCKELVLAYLTKYCYEVDELQPGDVISYRWGRSNYAHLAMYIGNGCIIHCSADNGTCITDLDEPALLDAKGRSRATGYWRLKDGTF